MPDIDYQDKRRQYLDDGFCVIENVLTPEMLTRMRTVTESRIVDMSEDDKREQRSTGSMISVGDVPEMAELITWAPALEAMERMGCGDVRFTSGYIISKPPQSPPLFWHFDWMGWAHPSSYEKGPMQTFFMYYLVDTNRDNGCLRVIPGTHLNDHPLHESLNDAHTPVVRRAENLDMPEFQAQPDEVDVPVRAGDLVIGDSRILHASHANNSDQRRTVITLWMFPNYPQMPEPMQAFAMTERTNNPQPLHAEEGMASILPDYGGNAQPIPRSRTRYPHPG